MEYDIIIVGTTIDRITSAIYALKLGKKVLIIESNILKEFCLSFEEIKDYSTKRYVDLKRFKDEIIELGGIIKNEEIIEINNNEVITETNVYKGKTIIIAIGSRHKLLELENEEKYIENGIHFCISCDAAFYKDEIGCVVGGSDYALENALKLSNICKKVIIIHKEDKFNADELLINEVYNKENIEIYYNTKIIELIGYKNLKKIILDNNIEINVDCIFLSNGFIPNIDIINLKNNNNKIYIVDNISEKKDEENGISIAIKVIKYLDN